MIKKTDRKMERTRRHIRVRRKVSGTAERPRLCVYRSNTNLYVQIIDDVAGNTLVSASTLDKDVKTKLSDADRQIINHLDNTYGVVQTLISDNVLTQKEKTEKERE